MKNSKIFSFTYNELLKVGEYSDNKKLKEIWNLQKNSLDNNYLFSVDKTYFNIFHSKSLNKSDKKFGWKLHIAIDDSVEENIKKGWNSIIPVLLKHKVASFKLIRKNRPSFMPLSVHSELECGNQVTIYCVKDDKDKKQWSTLLHDITQALVKNKVRPSPKSPVNKYIKGSVFVAYRNDAKPVFLDDGSKKYVYLDAKKNTKTPLYNPYNLKDEVFGLKDIDLTVNDYIERPIFDKLKKIYQKNQSSSKTLFFEKKVKKEKEILNVKIIKDSFGDNLGSSDSDDSMSFELI